MPDIEEIVPGLNKIRLPIPIRGLGEVFVYLFSDGKEGLLVDSGWDDEDCWNALRDSLSELDFKIENLKTIVLSHLHPDHIGLASRLKKESSDSKIFMHKADAQQMVYTPEAHKVFVERMEAFARMNGAPGVEISRMAEITGSMARHLTAVVRPDVLVAGGEKLVVGKWKLDIISTPGHTKGNICLYDAASNIFFSGDHILPKITPNVSRSPIYEGDPLGDYLRSLRNLKKLDPVKILPSHEYVFEHLGKRIEEIETHHEERLTEVMGVLGEDVEGKTGYEVATKLTWFIGSYEKLSTWSKSAALLETLAHLEYLKRNRKVLELHESSPAGETIRYSKTF